MINNSLFHNNRKTFNSVLAVLIFTILVFIAGAKWQGKNNQINSLSVELAKAKDTQEKVVYVEPETVEEYIKYVFEEDADKAFLLLRGKGDGTCAENRHLNPEAVNDNTTWGGVGRDIGVFQINTKWQKVQEKFLYNYKTNIQIAHQLFEENGKSFKLWTCGKVWGI